MMSPDAMPTDEQIADELRAMRPETSERFAAELDAWAAEGFPSAADTREPRSPGFFTRLRNRPLLPMLAGSFAVVVVVAVAVSISTTSTQDQLHSADSGSGGAAAEQAPRAADSIEPAPTTVVPPQPPIDEELKPGQERIQERSASMELSTDPDEVDDVADEVIDVVDRYDGIVVSSNVSSDGDRARASFDLRIPTANLQAALADLSDLASVSARNEGVLDITAPFVTAEERFTDAKAEVDSLVQQLEDADSTEEIASIRAELSLARSELAAARAELGALKQRADFSRLSLAVIGAGDADGWSLGDALDDAVSVLEDIAGAALVSLAVLVPLGLIAALAWFGLGAARRRSRERALDE